MKFARIVRSPVRRRVQSISGDAAAGEHRLARTAPNAFVLKNAAAGGSPLLPISDKMRNIALIGPLADDSPNMLGSWAGLGRGEDVISFHAALAKHVGEEHLFHVKGSGITDGTDADIAAAVAAAGKADLVVLALGENAGEMTGEAVHARI